MQGWLWTAEGILIAIALLAGIGDWRRVNRRRVDGWGWVPWRGLQMTALFAAMGIAMIALHR
ncbi:MAG: hypothetical protein AB7O91_07395 [Sphingomonas sp.]